MTMGTDLDYLNGYWKRVKSISDKINDELPRNPYLIGQYQKVEGAKFLHRIQYKDLDNWEVNIYGSRTLKALANKITTMIAKGRAEAVKRMVESICSGRVKKLYRPNHGLVGTGHFRWNYRTYILSETDIKWLKEYFKIS